MAFLQELLCLWDPQHPPYPTPFAGAQPCLEINCLTKKVEITPGKGSFSGGLAETCSAVTKPGTSKEFKLFVVCLGE
jgi:hypothetical protein